MGSELWAVASYRWTGGAQVTQDEKPLTSLILAPFSRLVGTLLSLSLLTSLLIFFPFLFVQYIFFPPLFYINAPCFALGKLVIFFRQVCQRLFVCLSSSFFFFFFFFSILRKFFLICFCYQKEKERGDISWKDFLANISGKMDHCNGTLLRILEFELPHGQAPSS